MLDLQEILKLGTSVSTSIQQGSVGTLFGRAVTYAATYPVIPVVIAIVAIAAIVFACRERCLESFKTLKGYFVQRDPSTIIINDWIVSSSMDQVSGKMIKDKILFFLNNLGEDTLDLSECNLKSLPNIFHLPEFKRLKTLDLSENLLLELPAEIGELTSLTKVHLSNNRLAKLPAEIGKLTLLTTLNLHHNELTELLPVIGNLTSLTHLFLENNRLTNLPSIIGSLKGLEALNLNDNQLTELPIGIGNLASLEWLNLSNNPLTVVPKEIFNLPSSCSINLTACQPISIDELYKLRATLTEEDHKAPQLLFELTISELLS